MKILKPLPHAVMDYAWAGTMMAAPWYVTGQPVIRRVVILT